MFPGFALRRIPYALAVAEELHFGRAALRLHVAQPSLSNQIRDLEEEIDVQLFDRNNQYVKLTPAGRRFIREAKLAVLHSERAVEGAKNSSRHDQSFVVGYSPQMNLSLLSAVRIVSSSQFPEFKVVLVSSHTDDQIHALLQGSIHLGLVTLPVKNEFIATKPLTREPLCVAIPQSHRFAAKADLKARELNGLSVISFPRHLNPVFHDHLHTMFKKEGYLPKVVQEVTTDTEALYMVSKGLGITFVKLSTTGDRHAGIAYRPFRESTLVQETGLAYRRDSRSRPIHAFVAALRKSVEQNVASAPSISESACECDARQLKLF
jgi:DNA-binding transcriptional LysR family regulator